MAAPISSSDGRLTPRKYPYPTRDYILRNDGGRFADVTEEVAPELVSPGGMITDAAWVDFDGDGHLDLVTVGEWMSIRFFRNDGNKFHDATESTKLPSMRGWWYSLAVGDFNKDGRPDLVAGNLGLNSSYTASKDTTFGVYANNFTGNQTVDLVLTQKVDDKEYSLAGMASLGRNLYPLTVMFPTYGSFAAVPLSQAFSSAQLQQALHYEVDTLPAFTCKMTGEGSSPRTRCRTWRRCLPSGLWLSMTWMLTDASTWSWREIFTTPNRTPRPSTPATDSGSAEMAKVALCPSRPFGAAFSPR